MPCCAFAACIVAQLLLAVRAIRRTLLGQRAGGATESNIAVEWRLDSVTPSLALAPALGGRLPGRRALRGLALVAAVELLLVLGAIYGVAEHLGHRDGHPGHVHHTNVAGPDGAAGGAGTLDPGATSSRVAFTR
jgi:hypothetical protein